MSFYPFVYRVRQCFANNRFHRNMLTWDNFEYIDFRKQITLYFEKLKLSPNLIDL